MTLSLQGSRRPAPSGLLGICEAARLDACGIPESTLDTQGPSTIAEYHAFGMASDEIGAAGRFALYPVRVLTATNHDGWSAAQYSLWQSVLASLAAEAFDGQQIIVQGSDHHIQLDRPDVVVNTILAALQPTAR